MRSDADELVPVVTPEQWNRHRAELCQRRVAVLIRGAVTAEELAGWTLDAIEKRCGDLTINASTALPRHGVPYAAKGDMRDEEVRFGDFIEHLRSGGAGYLTQAALSRFPALAARPPVRCPADERCHAVNLWVGGLTRSGFHYDSADNLFVQLDGVKRVVLSPCTRIRDVYPFPDNYSKSMIDFEQADWMKTHPRTRHARFAMLDVGPGDVLYMPRGWWHYLATDRTSVSLNIWFGRVLSPVERARRFGAAGPAVWRTVLRDFLALGVLGRPYEQRPYSPPPAGLVLAQRVGVARRRN